MTTTDWTTKRREMGALFNAFYELFSYENDLRLKRIEDKLDRVLNERVRPWNRETQAKATQQQASTDVPTLTDTGYIRLAHIRKYYVPVSVATWWRWVKDGRAPQPVKVAGVTFWKSKDIRAFLDAVPADRKRRP